MICIAPGHEWKTAFYKKKGLFESTGMQFRWTNVLATFQEMINAVFKDIEGCI